MRKRLDKEYALRQQDADYKRIIKNRCSIAKPINSSSKNTYIQKIDGRDAVRIKRGVSFEDSSKEFEKAVKQGKMVCLSDWMINAGM